MGTDGESGRVGTSQGTGATGALTSRPWEMGKGLTRSRCRSRPIHVGVVAAISGGPRNGVPNPRVP